MRQKQRAGGHGIFAELRKFQRRGGAKHRHDRLLERFGHRRSQWLADVGKAATEDDHVRVQQMHHVREREREIVCKPLKDLNRVRIMLSQRRRQMRRFPARRVADRPGEKTVGGGFFQLPNLGIDRPPRAARFDGRARPLKPKMPELRLAGERP